MMRLFTLQIEILDDRTYTPKQIEQYVKEAIEIHLECEAVNVKDVESTEVIATIAEMAEA